MNKAERTKQFIIEKAAPIFNRKGMAGTSISDIMEATQMAKGGIYGNFENKEEICARSLDYLLQQLNTAIEVKLAGLPSYKAQLLELLEFYKSQPGKEGASGCPMVNFGVEADDTNPEIKQQIAKAITATQSRIAKIIKKGIEAGEFKKGFDAESFAINAFSLIEGAMWVSRMQNSTRAIKTAIDSLKKEIDIQSK
ncbi:TetR/AcrR family transcriptional regulator [uncultured Chitinophaga sp.]|uniref:TetR/AcrR family transcriptional regulator n=1 Tax=uncultured Chitinophaga sp. TaxID=339340 RepID=UPI0025E1DB1F|nr:TetR/AcrR family transcriptional regulator [uncultured Chitinophaga sp.]